MKTDNLQNFFIFFVLCCFFVVGAEPTNVQRLRRADEVQRDPIHVDLNVTKPGKTFIIVRGFQSSWDEARAFCNKSGGDLASLQAEDFDLLYSSALEHGWRDGKRWLGGFLNDSSKEVSTTTPPPPTSTSVTTNDTSGTNRVKRTNGGNGGTNWLWLSGEPIPLAWKYWQADEPDNPSYQKCLFLGDDCLRRDYAEEKYDQFCLFAGRCEEIGDASQHTDLVGSICEVIEANATESTMNATASTATKLKANESTTTTESTGSKNMADVKIHPELIVFGFILISYSIVID